MPRRGRSECYDSRKWSKQKGGNKKNPAQLEEEKDCATRTDSLKDDLPVDVVSEGEGRG